MYIGGCKKVETSSIYETELMGAWLVVSVVHHQCYSQKLVFEGDSLMVINDINKKEGDNFDHPTLRDIWRMHAKCTE